MRKLFILKRIDDGNPLYDVANAMVVRCRTKRDARRIASSVAGDEGAEVWLNIHKSSCHVLENENGDTGLVIRDFRAG